MSVLPAMFQLDHSGDPDERKVIFDIAAKVVLIVGLGVIAGCQSKAQVTARLQGMPVTPDSTSAEMFGPWEDSVLNAITDTAAIQDSFSE